MESIDFLGLAYTLASGLAVLGVLFVGRTLWSKMALFDAEHQLTGADNPAVGTALFGYLGALTIVLMALLTTQGAGPGDTTGMVWDISELVLYGLLAIFLIKLSGFINDRAILKGFENAKELVQDRNVGVGAVLCGSYLASGLILAGAFSGRIDPGLLAEDASRLSTIGYEIAISLACYAFCQVALTFYGVVYQAVQRTSIHAAIAEDYEVDGVKHGGNVAAGIAFGGNLAALGLVMWGGAAGDFLGWLDLAVRLGVATALGIILLPLWRRFVDRMMMGKADLNKEIYTDRNVNAALLEAVSMLAMGGVIAALV